MPSVFYAYFSMVNSRPCAARTIFFGSLNCMCTNKGMFKILSQGHYNAFADLGIWGMYKMEFITFYVYIRTN